jgi:pyruvate/2-oxoacid:ferredoxin oxidoreductase alpha subunit
MLTVIKQRILAKALFMTILLLIGSGACAQGNNVEKIEKTKKVKKAKKKKKESYSIVEIEELRSKEYTIKSGQKISYTYKEHASVGITSTYSVDKTAILVYKELISDYKNKNREGLTGADEASITVIFEGSSKGNAVLTVKKMFRGNIEREFNITITVE